MNDRDGRSYKTGESGRRGIFVNGNKQVGGNAVGVAICAVTENDSSEYRKENVLRQARRATRVFFVSSVNQISSLLKTRGLASMWGGAKTNLRLLHCKVN